MENNKTIYSIIKDTEFSKYLSENTMLGLSKIMDLVNYKSSTVIYSKNEIVEKFLIINSGKCKLINQNGKSIRELNKNDFFGLISLFTNSKKNYDLSNEKGNKYKNKTL